MYLTHTSVNGQVALRMSIGATLTERHHVEQAWNLLSES
jgi:aromatic-L-amino-acid decarboxylase